MAVPGVILTTLIVGGLVTWLTPLGPPAALVFGAPFADTDPVAVVALFRALGVPKRLAVLMQCERQLNDGTAVVVFNRFITVGQTGRFDLTQGMTDFVQVAGPGHHDAFCGPPLSIANVNRGEEDSETWHGFLDRLPAEGLVSALAWEKLKPMVTQRAAAMADTAKSCGPSLNWEPNSSTQAGARRGDRDVPSHLA